MQERMRNDGQTRVVLCLNNLNFPLMHKIHVKITFLC